MFHKNEILGNVTYINVRPFSCTIPFLHLLLIFRRDTLLWQMLNISEWAMEFRNSFID